MSAAKVIQVKVGDLEVGDIVFAGYRNEQDNRKTPTPYGYQIVKIHRLAHDCRRIVTNDHYFGDFDDHADNTTRVIRKG